MLNSKSFDYNKTNKTFIAEMSELGSRVFERIFDDSCDLGITMVSDKTNVVAKFVVEEEVRNQDEITSWILVPTTETVRKTPGLEGTSVIIFND